MCPPVDPSLGVVFEGGLFLKSMFLLHREALFGDMPDFKPNIIPEIDPQTRRESPPTDSTCM